MTTKGPGTGSTPGVRVYRDGDWIRHDYIGDQTGETIEKMVKENDELLLRLQADHKEINILSDFSKIGKHTGDARVALQRYLGTRFFHKIAAFGLPSTLEITAWMILNITGKADQVQVFKTEADAKAWLKTA